jgi:hypothetical protein
MRFEIAIHKQRGGMRSDLPQQSALDEKPQIVVDRGQRNRWNAAPDRRVNIFRGIVSVGSDHGLVNHLTLMGHGQTVLRGQLTKLLVGGAHNYRIRMIIKRSGTVSTEIFRFTFEDDRGDALAVGIKTAAYETNSDTNSLKSATPSSQAAEKSGGDDGTRTRGLCRDRAAF